MIDSFSLTTRASSSSVRSRKLTRLRTRQPNRISSSTSSGTLRLISRLPALPDRLTSSRRSPTTSCCLEPLDTETSRKTPCIRSIVSVGHRYGRIDANRQATAPPMLFWGATGFPLGRASQGRELNNANI